MATIVTRAGKGAPLTHVEVDANFTNLNDDKLETSGGTMTGALAFDDAVSADFGSSASLSINSVSGVSSAIVDTTANLFVVSDALTVNSATLGQVMITAAESGPVELYYDNNLALSTAVGGTVDIPNFLSAGFGSFSGGISMPNFSTASFGDIGELIVGFDGTDGFVTTFGPNDIVIQTDGTERVRVTSTGDVNIGGTGAIKVPVGTDAERPTPSTGQLRFNTDASSFEGYDGTAWGAIGGGGGGQVSFLPFEYTATAGQTTFSGADDNAATLAYTVNNLIVTLNGVVLDNGGDYTATNGTSIVLTSGAAAGDLLQVIAFSAFTVADMVPASTGGTFSGNITAPKFLTTANKIETSIFRVNAQSLAANTTIDSDENASCTGPLTVTSGVTLTVNGNLAVI